MFPFKLLQSFYANSVDFNCRVQIIDRKLYRNSALFSKMWKIKHLYISELYEGGNFYVWIQTSLSIATRASKFKEILG